MNYLKRLVYVEWSIILLLQGYFSCDSELSLGYSIGLVLYVIILALISFVVINKLVARQSQQLVYLLMFMLIMALFAYPLKQLWIYTDPDILAVFLFARAMIDLNPQSIGWFLFIQYSAVLMLLLGMYLCALKKNEAIFRLREHDLRIYKSNSLSVIFITVTSILIIILLLAMKSFGMYMGGGGVSLPFHLAGIILYAHLILVPMLMLLCILVLPPKTGRAYLIAITLMVLIYIVGDMAVRLSRSSLLVVLMLLIGFVIASKPEKIKSFLRLGALSVVVTLVLIPVVTSLRMAHINENWSPSYIYEQYAYYSETVFSLFVMRITGAENASVAIGSIRFDDLDIMDVINQGVISYYTLEVLGFPEGANTAFTPSSLGEVLIVFGPITGFLVIFLVPLLLFYVNRYYYRRLSFTYPLFYAFLFSLAIKVATGGVFMKDIYTMFGAVLLAIFIDKMFNLNVRSAQRRNVIP